VAIGLRLDYFSSAPLAIRFYNFCKELPSGWERGRGGVADWMGDISYPEVFTKCPSVKMAGDFS